MNRRSLLTGLIAAPAVILTPKLLMPVRTWHDGICGEARVWFNPIPLPGAPFHHELFRKISTGTKWVDINSTEGIAVRKSFARAWGAHAWARGSI